jgi:hypothetical protein
MMLNIALCLIALFMIFPMGFAVYFMFGGLGLAAYCAVILTLSVNGIIDIMERRD